MPFTLGSANHRLVHRVVQAVVRPMHQRKTAAIRFTCPRVVSAAPALHDFLGTLAPPYKTRHDPDSRRFDAVCPLFRFDGIRFGLTARMADRAVLIELT